MLTKERENKIIRGGIILFWWFFWLFSVLDKIFIKTSYPLVGNERMAQFVMYLSSLGIHQTAIAYWLLLIISLAEVTALVFFTQALLSCCRKSSEKTHNALFYGVFVSLIIFSFFAIADQLFERYDYLFHHVLYWMAFVISWFVYTRSECAVKKEQAGVRVRSVRK